jgi:hypothetical protein
MKKKSFTVFLLSSIMLVCHAVGLNAQKQIKSGLLVNGGLGSIKTGLM